MYIRLVYLVNTQKFVKYYGQHSIGRLSAYVKGYNNYMLFVYKTKKRIKMFNCIRKSNMHVFDLKKTIYYFLILGCEIFFVGLLVCARLINKFKNKIPVECAAGEDRCC